MIKKVLVIDDEENIQTLIQIGLETAGYEVVLSMNASNGFDMAVKELPDLIILDVMMPDIDGEEMFRNLRNHPNTSGIPVIILTAKAKMEESFMNLGAAGFIEKPFQAGILESKVKDIIGESFPVPEAGTQNANIKSQDSIDQTEGKKFEYATGARTVDAEINRKFAGKVLVAGTIDHIVAFMKSDLEKANCLVEVVEEGEKVAETAFEFNPDVILLETQMGMLSAYELIQLLKERNDFRTQILLYSYHMDPQTARNSIVHLLLEDNQNNEKPADVRQPIYYFGIYNKKTFSKKIKRFIS